MPVDTFTLGAGLRLNWSQDGYNLTANGGYYSRQKWEPWGDPEFFSYEPTQKDYWKYSVELTKGFYFENFRKLLVKLSYLDGQDLDRWSQWDFGPFSTTALTGFPSGTVRADRAYEAIISYGLNIENDRPLRARLRPGPRHEPVRRRRQRVLLGHRDHDRRSTVRGTARASAPRSATRSSRAACTASRSTCSCSRSSRSSGAAGTIRESSISGAAPAIVRAHG